MNTLVEPLESRIAPATIVNPTTVTFQDVDGDDVIIKVSKPIFTDAATAGTLVSFTGSAFGDSGPQQLNALVLANLGAAGNGMDISVIAKRSAVNGGNGDVEFSHINASDVNPNTGVGAGIDLGKVMVQGSIAYVDAGDADASTPAMKSLDLRSLGAPKAGVTSDIFGSVGSIKIRGAMQGRIHTHDGPVAGGSGSIGSVFIGGSMGSFDGLGGEVTVDGDVKSFTLKGDLVGSSSAKSGYINVSGDVGKLAIGGSVVGGKFDTGKIEVSGNVSKLSIGGSIKGGSEAGSGLVNLLGSVGSATIGGSLIGTEAFTGVFDVAKDIGTLKIAGDVVGGSGNTSGFVDSGAPSGSFFLGGSVIGGMGVDSGKVFIFARKNFVGGSIVGGEGDGSGSFAGVSGNTVIRGSILGGAGSSSGSVFAGDIATMKIGGSIVGGSGLGSGVLIGGEVGSVLVKGDLVGGTSIETGQIAADSFGSVTVLGSVRGQSAMGSQAFAATIRAFSNIDSVFIGGDLVAGNIIAGIAPGGDADFGTNDDTDASANTISVIARIVIKGNVRGTSSGSDHYGIEANEIRKLTVGGVTFAPGDPGVNYAAGFTLGSTGDVTVRTL